MRKQWIPGPSLALNFHEGPGYSFVLQIEVRGYPFFHTLNIYTIILMRLIIVQYSYESRILASFLFDGFLLC